MNQMDVINNFNIGDVIRNVKPYWGEPTHTIHKRESECFYLKSNNSKFGPKIRKNFCTHSVTFNEFISEDRKRFTFKKCSRTMRLWLWFLGNTYGRVWGSLS